MRVKTTDLLQSTELTIAEIAQRSNVHVNKIFSVIDSDNANMLSVAERARLRKLLKSTRHRKLGSNA